MDIAIDEHCVWTATLKADRLLNRLSSEQIAHLGDGFDWRVTVADVTIARRYLVGARVEAILLGREIARMAERPDAIVPRHPSVRRLARL